MHGRMQKNKHMQGNDLDTLTLATRTKSPLQHINTTPPNPIAVTSPPPPPPPPTMTTTPRATTDHVLAFLDHEFWVCTYTLSETRPGRVRRHFFLPRDRLNLTALELAVMRRDGVLLCPRNGEVALVENGLREEWVE